MNCTIWCMPTLDPMSKSVLSKETRLMPNSRQCSKIWCQLLKRSTSTSESSVTSMTLMLRSSTQSVIRLHVEMSALTHLLAIQELNLALKVAIWEWWVNLRWEVSKVFLKEVSQILVWVVACQIKDSSTRCQWTIHKFRAWEILRSKCLAQICNSQAIQTTSNPNNRFSISLKGCLSSSQI